MDLISNHKGSRGGEKELVSRSSNRIGAIREGSDAGRGDGAGGHVVSVDLGALEVVDEAVGVVDSGIESRNGSAVGDGASETVVTGGGSEGGEVACGGGGPASVVVAALGPVIGSLGSIGVLPLGERGGKKVDGEGVGAVLEGGTRLVGKTASVDLDTTDGDGHVSGRGRSTPTVTIRIDKLDEVVALFHANRVSHIDIDVGRDTSDGENLDAGLRGAFVEGEGLFSGEGGVVLDDSSFELRIGASEA